MKKDTFNKIIILTLIFGFVFISAKRATDFPEYAAKVDLEEISGQIKSYDYRETKYQVEIIEILVQTERENLPVFPLINKVKEGLAKDIGLKSIRDTVSKSKENFKSARNLLNELKNRGLERGINKDRENDTIISLGEFLTRGLTEELLRDLADKIMEQKGDLSRFVTLSGLFIDLKEKELEEDTIWAVVKVILEQNISDVDTKAIINSIYKKVDSGENVETFVRQLEENKPSRVLIRK